MRSTFRICKNYLKSASDLHENRLRCTIKDQGSTSIQEKIMRSTLRVHEID